MATTADPADCRNGSDGHTDRMPKRQSRRSYRFRLPKRRKDEWWRGPDHVAGRPGGRPWSQAVQCSARVSRPRRNCRPKVSRVSTAAVALRPSVSRNGGVGRPSPNKQEGRRGQETLAEQARGRRGRETLAELAINSSRAARRERRRRTGFDASPYRKRSASGTKWTSARGP